MITFWVRWEEIANMSKNIADKPTYVLTYNIEANEMKNFEKIASFIKNI